MTTRRKVLAGLAALIGSAKAALAQRWAPFMASSGSTGVPAGVTLQAIDGGSTYYADNSFTYAANAASTSGIWAGCSGWDDPHFFPIGTWLDVITVQSDARAWHDLGVNTMFACFSNTNLRTLRANSIWLIQITGQNGAGKFGGMAGTGSETVGLMTYDEPQNWAEATTGIGGCSASFTGYMDTLKYGGALYVAAVSSGIIVHYAPITGGGVTAGTAINGFGTGNGGVGDYSVFPQRQTVASAGSHEAMSMSLPATANSIQDHRFWWCNFTNAQLGSAPAFAPGGNDMRVLMTTAVATPSGTGIWATRRLNIIGMDWYPMSAGSNFNAGLTTANIFGFALPSVTFTSMTIGTPPYTTIPFTLTGMPQPFIVGASAQLDAGSGNTQFGTIASFDPVTGNTTMNITSVGGAGTFSTWQFEYAMPASQMNRATHYGNQVDMFREYYPAPKGPCYTFIEASDPYGPTPGDNGARWVKPFELNAMVWSTIMHRARWIVYFTNWGGNNGRVSGGAFFGAWGHTTQSGNTISQYDQAKATHRLIQTLAPVINSPFVVASPTQPVTVSSSAGAGFTLPYTPYTIPGPSQSKFNNSLDPLFEVMAHWYNFPTEIINGVALVQNKLWIWAMYRGPGSDTDIVANFTIVNTGATSVTRIYSDGVIGVTTGAATTVQVGDTSWISPGDTVTIVGTAGVRGLNGTFSVSSVKASPPSFVIPVSSSGSLTTNGTAIVQHNITVTGGTTFADTFPYGTSVGIYRVN